MKTNTTRTILSGVAVVLFFVTFLSSCGSKSGLRHLETKITKLEQTLAEKDLQIEKLKKELETLPQEIIAQYEQQKEAEQEAYQQELIDLKLHNLNLKSLPILEGAAPTYNISFIRNIEKAVQIPSIVDITSSYIGTALGLNRDYARTIKDQLANADILQKLLRDNKEHIPALLELFNATSQAKKDADILLPYFQKKSKNISLFDAYFKKYGDNQTFIPRDTEEWKIMEAKLGFSRDELNTHYWAYLWAKRRTQEGTGKIWEEALLLVKKIR